MLLVSDAIKLLVVTLTLTFTHAMNFEYRLIQANNIQRQELLQQKCDKYDLDNNELYQNNSIHTLNDADLEHLLIDRKHKLLYCYVPKVSLLIAVVSSNNQSPFLGLTDTRPIPNIDGIIFECPGNVRWNFFFVCDKQSAHSNMSTLSDVSDIVDGLSKRISS